MTTMLNEPPVKEKKGKAKKVKADKSAAPVLDFAKFSAIKPTPLLVPRYVRERRAADKTTRIVLFSGLGVLLLLVLAVGAGFFYAQGEKTALDDAVNEQKFVQVEVDRLQPIATYYDGLVSRQELASTTMQNDVAYDRLMNGVYTAAAGSATVSAVTVAPGVPCAGPDPFNAVPAIGCITITAETSDARGAASFVDALNARDELFTGAFAPSFASDAGTPISVTVNYDADALSMRFVPKDRQEEVRASVNAGSAATTPTGVTP